MLQHRDQVRKLLPEAKRERVLPGITTKGKKNEISTIATYNNTFCTKAAKPLMI